MNNCFGIITLNQVPGLHESHLSCFQKLHIKFPGVFRSKEVHGYPNVEIIGDIEKSIYPGKSSLFVCGEIYNAEILPNGMTIADRLHLQIERYGIEGLTSLNGRFAIVYSNPGMKTIHIINDQMGIQQLFFYKHKDFILFGSEIKFLLAHPLCPCEIDWENSLKRALPFQVINGARNYNAWFKQIELLPEGSEFRIHLDTKQTVIQRYWDGFRVSGKLNANDNRTIGQVMDEYMELLEDAVKIRIQDHEQAYSLLSGGLDSSILCAMAAKYKSLDTYSIVNRTTCLEDTTLFCDQLSKDLNFKNSQFLIPVHKLSADRNLWKQRIWRAESPFNHPDSLSKTLLHYSIMKKNPEVPYTLTGTGSDQWNGGLVRWVINDSENQDDNWKNFYKQIIEEENKCFIDRRFDTLWSSREFVHRDFLESISNQAIEKNSWMYYVNSNLHLNMFSLLWDENRAASSHNHSIRYPFLDYRFAAFVAGIPESYHAQLFYDKQILRKPSAKLLPEYVINKPKAPAVSGLYDFRFNSYNALLGDEELILVQEAFGELRNAHPVINTEKLVQAIQRLKTEPDPFEWQYVFHIINLGLLEKLVNQDESTMSYEQTIPQPSEILFSHANSFKEDLEKTLDIIPEQTLFNKPVLFEKDCGLVFDKIRNTYFLFKNNILSYEIDDSNPGWKKFLLRVNQSCSTQEILNEEQINFDDIREYYNTLIKEQILTYRLNG